jgi:Cu-processing system permease protein
MMDATTLFTMTQKEWRDAQRNRWVALLAAMFAVLSLALSALGLSGLGTIGITGFGRTAASLLNLVLLLVPLMGLLMGAVSVAAEREQGTLLTLMAQPVTPSEVLLGKFFGTSLALVSAIGLGFGFSGLVIIRGSGLSQFGVYLNLVGLTLLLGIVHVGIGICLSVMTRRSATAIGLAVFVWLFVAFLSDLGVMGTSIVLRLTPAQLLWVSLGNPVQLFKLAAIHALHGNLELLGSSGLYAASVLGHWLLPVLAVLLVLWVLLPLTVAFQIFHRRGAL